MIGFEKKHKIQAAHSFYQLYLFITSNKIFEISEGWNNNADDMRGTNIENIIFFSIGNDKES